MTGARLLVTLVLVTLLATTAALLVGPFPATPGEVAGAIASTIAPGVAGPVSPSLQAAIVSVRLPRVLLALLVGMALAASGAAYQSVFRNPLVSAHVLGVASGASFGAAVAIMLSAPTAGVQAAAFVVGLTAVAIVLAASRLFPGASPLYLVLMGLVAGSFFSALVSLLTYVATPDQKMPAIVFWLMGSLSASTPAAFWTTLPLVVFPLGGLLAARWRLNVLSMGDEDAQSMGVEARRWRVGVILCCTVMTAAAVCACGVVGWVGLVIPHAARLLAGPDHRRLLPASALLGGSFMLLVDAAARTLSASEIPLGILTGIVGAPAFAVLLFRAGRRS
jgi:iron complex transport system permease protein